jgi:hypothetical protein
MMQSMFPYRRKIYNPPAQGCRLTRRIEFVIKNGLFFGRNGNAENADFFLLKPLDFFLVEIFS